MSQMDDLVMKVLTMRFETYRMIHQRVRRHGATWAARSIRESLKRLTDLGLVEREDRPNTYGNRTAYFRKSA